MKTKLFLYMLVPVILILVLLASCLSLFDRFKTPKDTLAERLDMQAMSFEQQLLSHRNSLITVGAYLSGDAATLIEAYLADAGISFDELQAYVLRGEPLPKKPVVITFDDGYLSNYTLAYPILQKYGMKAAIFSIGVSFGKDHYKDTDYAMTPHFGAAEAAEMAGSGLISIQSHTYDMHQWPPYEDGSAAVRENILQLPGESEEAYVEALTADFTRSRAQLEAAAGRPVDVLAYPAGQYSTLAQVTLQNLGVHVTLSTNPGINTVVKGLPQTLYAMLRFGITEDVSPEALLDMIR